MNFVSLESNYSMTSNLLKLGKKEFEDFFIAKSKRTNYVHTSDILEVNALIFNVVPR